MGVLVLINLFLFDINFVDVDDHLICYVHHVTPKKSVNLSYTSCELQISSSNLKAVSFSPEKTNPLNHAMAGKSPVKIRKFEFNTKFNNVVITKNTIIEHYKEPINFTCADSTAPVTVSDLYAISPGQLVNVTAKVTHMTGVKVIKMDDGTLKQTRAILVDPTGSIKVVFWQEWVDSVEDGETYTFTNLRVKEDYHSHEKFVNTAKAGCKIEASVPFTQPLPDVKISLTDIATKEATISVVGVKTVSKYFSCNTCSRKLEERGIKYYCRSCNMKQKPVNDQWFCKLRVKDSSSQQFNISVFHPEMLKLLQTQGKAMLPTLTTDEVEDILLDITNVHITMNVQQGKLVDILESNTKNEESTCKDNLE